MQIHVYLGESPDVLVEAREVKLARALPVRGIQDSVLQSRRQCANVGLVGQEANRIGASEIFHDAGEAFAIVSVVVGSFVQISCPYIHSRDGVRRALSADQALGVDEWRVTMYDMAYRTKCPRETKSAETEQERALAI